ncbi:MAG TPA: hypothetical protein VES42_02410 [Pilimelia sp.]|nr:hypothetical protein [Pilimelia sp.]
MRKRWLTVGVLGLALFAINVVARLVARLAFNGDLAAADRITLAMLLAVGVTCLVVATFWARHHEAARWTADLSAAALLGLLLAVLVGPFVSGAAPFGDGAGEFFKQIWQWAGFAIAGAVLGYSIVTALGLDHRSVLLKRFAEAKRAKPRRVVRR